MDTLTLILVVGTVILLYAAHQAHRLGNERRDVALLGLFGGVCGVGTTAAAFL